MTTGLDRTYHAHRLFLVAHFNFLSVPCGGLSWLPVSFLLHVKYTLLYRMEVCSIHGVAPAYLSDLYVPATAISGCQHLRSTATGTMLHVPHARPATGQRSFAVNGPATWNRLPPALRSPDLSESAF